jgi:hypothetical protein
MATLITKITLENFQSIKERVSLPIKPLTILVGPNSAGKSSVYDALDIFELLFIHKRKDDLKLVSLLKKWARLERGNEKGLEPDLFYDERTTFLGLSIEVELDKDYEDWESIQGAPSIYSFMIPQGKTLIEVDYGVVVGASSYLNKFNIFANGKKFVEVSYEVASDAEDNKSSRYFYKEIKIHDSPIVEYIGSPCSEDGHSYFENFEIKKEVDCIFLTSRNNPDQWVLIQDGNVQPLSFIEFDGMQSSYMNPKEIEFLGIYKAILKFIFEHIEAAIVSSLPKVEASRSIPTLDENIYFYNGGDEISYLYEHLDKPTKKHVWNETQNELALIEAKINKNINPHWYWLTYAFAHQKMIELTDYLETNHRLKYSGELTTKLTEKINYYLSNELFKDTGYRLGVNIHVLAPNEMDATYLNYKTGAIANLYLANANGVKHEFQDVGSGIAYVIPVLCALLGYGLAKVQQPELHIHPSLQSAIGDICIDSVLNNHIKQVKIDTHSEHFILRVLRIIRNKSPSDPLKKFGADDLSVLYFEPQIESLSTKIKHLRVSEDGSFVDEWPKGFFMERYSDIFDE